MKDYEIKELLKIIFKNQLLARGTCVPCLSLSTYTKDVNYLYENEYILLLEPFYGNIAGNQEIILRQKSLKLINLNISECIKPNTIFEFEKKSINSLILENLLKDKIINIIDNDDFLNKNILKINSKSSLIYKIFKSFKVKDINILMDKFKHNIRGKLENYINYRIYFFYVLRLYDLKMRESLFDFNYYNDPNILIGNGNTINYTEGCTSNKFIIKNMINNENNLYSNQDWNKIKKQLNELLEVYKYLIYDFFGVENIIDFLSYKYKYGNEKYNIMNIENNTYMQLFFGIGKKLEKKEEIMLEDIGIELFPLIEETYNNLSKTNQIENFDLILKFNYRDFFCASINNLYKPKKLDIIKKDIDNKYINHSSKIFTTNYDDCLELLLNRKDIIHLHGLFTEKDYNNYNTFPYSYNVIYGYTYKDKINKLNEEEVVKINEIDNINGALMIVGYSYDINDDHINSRIRTNKKINKIVYYCYNFNGKNLKEKNYLYQAIVRSFTIPGDNKKVIILDSEKFYT